MDEMQPSNDEERETLLEFPCDFSIKAMGLQQENFDALVVSLIRQHCTDLYENGVKQRLSSGGKFVSVTVKLHVTSQAQLDDIYRTLSGHPDIRMVL